MSAWFIEPMDVWLFRDGKPFNAQGDQRAESLFPPQPTTVVGSIRSHILYSTPSVITQKETILGTGEMLPQGVSFTGPFIARRQDNRIMRFFPQPADAITLDMFSHIIRPAAPPARLSKNQVSSSPTPYLLGLGDPMTKGEEGLWLNEDALFRYLRGLPVQGIPEEQLFEHQSYFGIEKSGDQAVVVEGALFEVNFVRPERDVGLYLEVNGYDDYLKPEQAVLRLGGESRIANIEPIPPIKWPVPPNPLPPRFKVYFATPALFWEGWLPTNWSTFFKGDIRLVAAATGRYEVHSGYDYTSPDHHKPGYRYIPAGSVYYFTAGNKAEINFLDEKFRITDKFADFGFGQVLIGGW